MAWRHKETGEEVFRIQYIENKQYWRLDQHLNYEWCAKAETVDTEWGEYETRNGDEVEPDEMEWVDEEVEGASLHGLHGE